MRQSSPKADLRFLLAPLIPLYWILHRLDRAVKTAGRKRARGAVIVSVGNLTTGGTGKTPFVAWLAKKLSAFRPVVLTRGYGSGLKPGVYRYGDPSFSAADEPALISRISGARISVDGDRFKGWMRASALSKTFILDDGFQSFRMARDLEIVLLDASAPESSYRLLPAGDLREPLSSLSRADAVVLTRVLSSRPGTFLLLKKWLAKAGIGPSRTFACDFPATGLFDAKDRRVLPSTRIRRVAAFAGIARFNNFRRSIREILGSGREIRFIRFPDHHRYNRVDLRKLSAMEKAGYRLVATEKDAVKLTGSLPGLLTLRIGCRVHREKEFLKFVTARLRHAR